MTEKRKYKSMRLGYGNGKVERMLSRGWKLETISGGGLGGARVATFSKETDRSRRKAEKRQQRNDASV